MRCARVLAPMSKFHRASHAEVNGLRERVRRRVVQVEFTSRARLPRQSPQFSKQMAMAAGFGKVTKTGPVSREPVVQSRHGHGVHESRCGRCRIDSHDDVIVLSGAAGWRRPRGRERGSRRGHRADLLVRDRSAPVRSRIALEDAKGQVARGRPRPDGRLGHDLDPPARAGTYRTIVHGASRANELAFVGPDYPTTVRLYPHGFR